MAQYGFWVLTFIKIALLLVIVLTVNAYLTWFERKVVAHMQSRIGPHRVGPHGLLQPAADGLKFLFKEDAMPAGVDKFVYLLAPFLALTLSLASLAVIPFGPKPLPFPFFGHQIDLWITNPDIGLLILFAVTALGVYGVALAGWASNSKYPLLGGLRSSAQMVSYELALTMSVVGVVLMANTFSLTQIIEAAVLFGAFFPHGTLSVSTAASRRLSGSCASLSRLLPKPIACLLTCPKLNRNWSRASIPSIPASNSPCFLSRNTPA
jgi:NADH-quinone oxidoreductase subunit H